MPAQKKQTNLNPTKKMEDQPIEMPEAPEIVEIANAEEPADAPREWAWPESKMKCAMFVEFNDNDRSQIALEMSEKILNAEKLKAQKKAMSQSLKGEIDELTSDTESMAMQLEKGGTERLVECQWVFERSMVPDDLGGHILVEDLSRKTLVRLDTGIPVRSEMISDEERQATMALDESPANADNSGTPADDADAEDDADTDGE